MPEQRWVAVLQGCPTHVNRWTVKDTDFRFLFLTVVLFFFPNMSYLPFAGCCLVSIQHIPAVVPSSQMLLRGIRGQGLSGLISNPCAASWLSDRLTSCAVYQLLPDKNKKIEKKPLGPYTVLMDPFRSLMLHLYQCNTELRSVVCCRLLSTAG